MWGGIPVNMEIMGIMGIMINMQLVNILNIIVNMINIGSRLLMTPMVTR